MSGPRPDESPPAARWPTELQGVTETIVTTAGPDGAWNLAALGLHAPADDESPVTARTWGRTRTRRNFAARGEGVVHFWVDPVDFVDAALDVRTEPVPVLDRADAWVRVHAEQVDSGSEAGTEWVEWAVVPVESVRRSASVQRVNRGFNAVVEATVVASRLDVSGYETATARERLAYLLEVARKCGGQRERAAADRVASLVDA